MVLKIFDEAKRKRSLKELEELEFVFVCVDVIIVVIIIGEKFSKNLNK